MKGCRGVVAYDQVVFTLGVEGRKVGAVKVFFLSANGILLAEFVDAFEGVECAVDPDVRLDDALLDEREVPAARDFVAGIRIDDLECHHGRVGHVGVLVVLGPEAALVDADGTPVIDVQGIQVTSAVDLVGAVDDREIGRFADKRQPEQGCYENRFFHSDIFKYI